MKKDIIIFLFFLLVFQYFLFAQECEAEEKLAYWFEKLCFSEEKGTIPVFGPNGPTSNVYYFSIWDMGEKANDFLMKQKGNHRKTNLIISPFSYELNAENIALLLLIDINYEREAYVEQISKFINIEPGLYPVIQLMKWIGNNTYKFSMVVNSLFQEKIRKSQARQVKPEILVGNAKMIDTKCRG